MGQEIAENGIVLLKLDDESGFPYAEGSYTAENGSYAFVINQSSTEEISESYEASFADGFTYGGYAVALR